MIPEALPEKWIAGLDAHASVADAAQHVLDRRVGSVASILKALAKSKADGDQHVHQIRVATRRAQSALLSFKPWLRRERRRAANKALRRIRTAAGVVRMCDVHRGILLASCNETVGEERMAVEAALMMLRHDRSVATAVLFRLAGRDAIRRVLGERRGRWFRRTDDESPHTRVTLDAQPLPSASVHDAGDAALRSLARKVLDRAQGELVTRENLHDLRLRCKRLRYAIEIFGATSTHIETLAPLSATLIDLQERLGAVNDSHEVAERLVRSAAALEDNLDSNADHPSSSATAVRSALAPLVARFADRFESQCARLAAAFHDWWQGEEARTLRDALELIAAEPAPAINRAIKPAIETANEPAPAEVVVLPHRNGVVASSAAETESPEGEE